MLNNTNPLLVVLFETRRDVAFAAASDALAEVRRNPADAKADEKADALWAAYEKAEDDLREVRSGYRQTYPHAVTFWPHGRRYYPGVRR